MTSALVSLFFMGYMYRYHPVWFRKYNYLLGVGAWYPLLKSAIRTLG
jgi:hypothetical protein